MKTKGESLAQISVSVPSFLGLLPFLVKDLVKNHFPINTWKAGDVVITNDTWLCTGHKPDVGIVTPIFTQNNLIGFIPCIAHSPAISGTFGEPIQKIFMKKFYTLRQRNCMMKE